MSNPVPTIQVGQTVPDFEMTTFDPKTGGFGKFDLAAQRAAKKWTLLVFYPADFTFVCATEFAALSKQYDAIRELGGELVTVSTDTEFTHLAWQREEGSLQGVKYPMGADRTGKVTRLFGIYDEGSGHALRGTYVIDPSGKLLSSEVHFYNSGRNVDELMRKFKANVYLAKHPDEGCPANWKSEGDATLKPGAKLVGRVAQALSGSAGNASGAKSKK